jgi:hypothetical protein
LGTAISSHIAQISQGISIIDARIAGMALLGCKTVKGRGTHNNLTTWKRREKDEKGILLRDINPIGC